MFRRKDELDLDTDIDTQGSLLGGESDTVSVLSPEKAAEYQAEKKQEGAQATSETYAKDTPEASASAPQSFGQTARPIPASTTTEAPRPATPINTGNANQAAGLVAGAAPIPTPATRSAAEAPRFRAPQEVRPVPTAPSIPSSNYNNESPTMINNKHNQNERVLTVGNDILLKGEITTCDRLVIEGNVDATVSEVTTIVLAEAGSFKGTAEVEFAEISGEFNGDLTVHGSLMVHRTGRISGSVTYGEIEIARGGGITGEIRTVGLKANVSKKEEKAAA